MAGRGSFASFGAPVQDLDLAWQERLEDARILLAQGRTDSALIQAIYALEIRLKERICRQLDLRQLPHPLEIHDLQGLLIVSGLSGRMEASTPLERRVRVNWNILRAYADEVNDQRYKPQSMTPQDAQALMDKLTNPQDGVLTWISTQP